MKRLMKSSSFLLLALAALSLLAFGRSRFHPAWVYIATGEEALSLMRSFVRGASDSIYVFLTQAPHSVTPSPTNLLIQDVAFKAREGIDVRVVLGFSLFQETVAQILRGGGARVRYQKLFEGSPVGASFMIIDRRWVIVGPRDWLPFTWERPRTREPICFIVSSQAALRLERLFWRLWEEAEERW